MAEVSLVNLPLNESHSILLMISQHWLRYWLGAVRPYGVIRPQWVKEMNQRAGVAFPEEWEAYIRLNIAISSIQKKYVYIV